MIFSSVRFKIFSWAVVLMFLAFLAFSVLLFRSFSNSLYVSLDEQLELRADGVAASIDTYWETHKLEALNDNADPSNISKIDNENFTRLAQKMVEEQESNDPRLTGSIVEIFDNKGETIAYFKINSLLFLTRDNLEAALKSENRFEDLTVKLAGAAQPVKLRAFIKPVKEENRVAYIIQVARPLTGLDNSLKQLRFTLLLLLPLVFLAAGVLGAVLASLALKPIRAIAEDIKKVTDKNLKLRVAVPKNRDEIAGLAVAFNEMIEKLEKAFALQQQFTQDISHELKTPLTIMRGEIEVALKKKRNSSEYVEILNTGREEIKKMALIVEDILMLARMEAKEINLEKKPVDLYALVSRVIKNFKVLAEAKKITLTFSGKARAVVAGDELQLQRLFSNLLDNAIKYTEKGGQVEVSYRVKNEKITFSIADTGWGIASPELKKIFDRFYRVDKARSPTGYGLGLSIAKTIACAHGGTITVKSRLNKGSVFTVALKAIVS